MIQIGEGFAGEGADAAHVNTVLGRREGPVGTAFATALATPSAGHVPFLVIVRPNLPAKPMTLFVTKSAISSELHGKLTWGAAQAGVAGGVADALNAGVIPQDGVDDLALITAVWVNPDAVGEQAVYANNRAATMAALQAGASKQPALSDVLAAAWNPYNPYFDGPR